MKTQLATMVKLTKGAGLPPEPGGAGGGEAGRQQAADPRPPVSTQCVQVVADPQAGQALQLSPGGDRHSEVGESYTILDRIFDILKLLITSTGWHGHWIDTFADDSNHLCSFYWTEYDNAMGKQWDEYDKSILWVNPPFSKWPFVAAKVLTTTTRCVAACQTGVTIMSKTC